MQPQTGNRSLYSKANTTRVMRHKRPYLLLTRSAARL
jgi:hypothetical protein